MKKLFTLGIVALLAMPFTGPAAHAGNAAAPAQTVEGSILLPAPFAQSATAGEPFEGCWGGATRRSTGQTGGAVNGVSGYYFDVDKKTWNKPFKLEVTGGQGTVDLDLFLYIVYPGPTAAIEEVDPVNGGATTSVDFQTREEGGEIGKVPPKAVKGIVCMYGGPSHQGFDATFTYTAG